MSTNNITKHTLIELSEIIGDPLQSEDLHIHFNENGYIEIPIMYPFRSSNFAIILLLSGKAKVQVGLINYDLEKNNALVISPNTVIQLLAIQEKVKVLSISFTYDFAFQHCFRDSDIFQFLAYQSLSKFVFNEKEVTDFKTMALFLKAKNLNRKRNLFGPELIHHSFRVLMYELAKIHHRKENKIKITSRNEELALNFIKILKDNFKTARNVQFYADALFVTRGHLTKVLKQVSGKTARQLIKEVVIMEAKILLNNPTLTIMQVSHELQFSDQSFFGKFFKKHTGKSPSFYRKKRLIS